jgi:hypothetical protein
VLGVPEEEEWTMSKTWVQLLGADAQCCAVDGQYIVRIDGCRRRVLQRCDTPAQAMEVFAAWLAEVVALPKDPAWGLWDFYHGW